MTPLPDIIRYPDKGEWKELVRRPVLETEAIDKVVLPILEDVRIGGDKALLEYTRKYDGAHLEGPEVTHEEMLAAEKLVDRDLRQAISLAYRNIETFHRSQQIRPKRIRTSSGVTCWQKSVAIEKVGLYVPGGSAPLFSTVLMLAVPARIAGCSEIILCTPPDTKGRVHPAILYAASCSGVTRVFRAGGAQAIAAMAYGTESVPPVDKIFGPGNQYVMAAKQIVSRGRVAIDMPAGPSEVMVLADDSARPGFVAADLLSQAEHGCDSQVLLVSVSERLIRRARALLLRHLAELPRKDIAARALSNSRFILVRDAGEMVDLANAYAPEHLIISASNAGGIAEKVIHAGSVFIGNYTPESAGDYLSGTNHTLPTNGYARIYSGVNLDSFVRKITFQRITRKGLKAIGPAIIRMADTEQLTAHSLAVSLRIK